MAMKYAKRMDNLKASDLKDILKVAAQPEIISFGGGLPAPELFPVDEMIVVSKQVIEEKGAQALQYGPTEGYLPLREAIAKRMEKMQAFVKAEEILITNH